MTDPTPPPVLPSWTPPPPAYAQPGYPFAPQRPTNGMAIASMVTSIVAVAGLCFYGVGGLLFGPVGAILGHVSRRKLKERNEQGEGMALVGIVAGWVATGLGVLIIAGIVILFALVINTSGLEDLPNQ
ncbi:MAG TPA: hypothetical protein DGT23_32895 [Micromonosporaceae bacterium]|nr:hypothetical protein [Micromonosporaceae bacterium]